MFGYGRKHWTILGVTINKPVWLLDGWHLSKFIMLFSYMSIPSITIALFTVWWVYFVCVLGLSLIYGLIFENFYR